MANTTTSSNSTGTTDTKDTDDSLSLGIIIAWVVIGAVAIGLIVAEYTVPRSRGRKILSHGIFLGIVVAFALIVPHIVQEELFTPLGVTIVGTVFPIYASVRAVSTPGQLDDKAWLQYWISQAILSYTTEFMEPITRDRPMARLQWFRFVMFFFIWLLNPFTDGSALLFDTLMAPFLAPLIQPLAKRMDGWISAVVSTVVSAAHLWILWFAFVLLPARLKRFVTVSVGVVYPILASIVAGTTITLDDDTYWLTYWSCYGCLFLIMEFLEHFYLGRVPGFYTLFLFSSVYLFLPLFRGADKVFRTILVPLAGLQDLVATRDALKLKKDVMKSMPKSKAASVRKSIAESFAMEDDVDSPEGTNPEDDPLVKYSSYNIPTETTPLNRFSLV